MALGSLQPPRADIIQHIYLEDLNALGLAGAERATGCFRWLGGGVYGYFTGFMGSGLWVREGVSYRQKFSCLLVQVD